MAVVSVVPLIIILLITFVLLLSSPKTRAVAAILFGSLLVLTFLGIALWRVSEVPRHSQAAQIDLPPGYRQYPQIDVGNNAVPVSSPAVQPHFESVQEFDKATTKSAKKWANKSIPLPPGYSATGDVASSENKWPNIPVPPQITFDEDGTITAAMVTGPNYLKLIILLGIGLLIIGGLVLAIAMLFKQKTRMAGVTILVAGPIFLILIAIGLTYHAYEVPRPSMINMTPPRNATAINTFPTSTNLSQEVPAVPLPPAYNVNSSSPITAVPAPNTKQLFEAYESAINYYCKAIAQPLKIDKTENLSEKVSTLRISFRDIGEVTVSGSSIMINSIGQAVAKAMTERMKEKSTQVEINPANSAKISTTAPAPANVVSVQPVSANAPLKNDISAEKTPAKTNPVEIAKAPKTRNVEPAVLAKAEVAEIAKEPSDPNRPDWVGKPPYLRRAGAELPDYYQVGKLKTNPPGDEYLKVVSTDPYTTRLECEAKIPEVLQEAMDQFVETYPGHQWAGYVRLPPDQLRQLVVVEYEEPWQSQSLAAPMPRIHLLLNFDQKIKELINDAVNSRLFTDRASVAGSVLIGLWLLLAVVWGYLKIDLTTKGAYRKRLRAAAGFAIITIVALGLLVLRSLA